MVKYITQTTFIGVIILAIVLSGCTSTREIKLSENVKNDILAKVDNNKIKSEPILKKKLEGLSNQRILFWIDNENILTTNPGALKENGGQVVLYSYNVESGESTEILNDDSITKIYDCWNGEGLILVGNENKIFVFDPKDRNLKEVLDINKEFEDGLPGAKTEEEKKNLFQQSVHLIKENYICYVSKITSRTTKGIADKAEYTILNYKDNKKDTIESHMFISGLCCKFDLTGRNIYIEELDKIIKLNLETREKSIMKLNSPKIMNVFEDGTLFVMCTEENKNSDDTEKLYKVDFDNKEVTKYEDTNEEKALSIQGIDFKNQFVGYAYYGEDKDGEKHYTTMYGKLEGDKFIVKDKLFKSNEEKGCNIGPNFVFSPDHNKFVTRIVMSKGHDLSPDNIIKFDEYLFELK